MSPLLVLFLGLGGEPRPAPVPLLPAPEISEQIAADRHRLGHVREQIAGLEHVLILGEVRPAGPDADTPECLKARLLHLRQERRDLEARLRLPDPPPSPFPPGVFRGWAEALRRIEA